MYCLLEGAVELTQSGSPRVRQVEPFQSFGYFALLDRRPRIFTARATEDSVVLRIGADDFFDEMADHTEIAHGVFEVLGTELRAMLFEETSAPIKA